MRHDLVIRGGELADGHGGPLRQADVAADNGRITAVGRVPGSGRDEIDARGKLVTPGFVDIHTHYDGQASWDTRMQPSSWHGVTTAGSGKASATTWTRWPASRATSISPPSCRMAHCASM